MVIPLLKNILQIIALLLWITASTVFAESTSSSLSTYLFTDLTSLEDTTALRYGIYSKDGQQNTDHVLMFFLGKGEWIEKYTDVYDILSEHLEYPILIVDHPGQGGSAGERGHIGSYDEYVKASLSVLADRFPRTTYSILGHSMGGLIALYGTVTQRLMPEKLILSSPLLGMRDKPVPAFVARHLSGALSAIGLSHMRTPVASESSYSFEENRLTTDMEKYLDAKQVVYPIPSPSMGWVNATFLANDVIHNTKYLKTFSTDTLIFYAEHEFVVSKDAIPAWVDRAQDHSAASIELILFEGAKHELFNERESITTEAIEKTLNFLLF